MSQHPKGAIIELEELENICAIGLSVWMWDQTRNVVELWAKPQVRPGSGGKIISALNRSGYYVAWMHIKDPSFTHSLLKGGDMYLFNTEEQAQSAFQPQDIKQWHARLMHHSTQE